MPQKKPFNKYLRSGCWLPPQEISGFYLNFYLCKIATEKMHFLKNGPFFSPCPRLNVFFEMHSECYNLTRLSMFGSLGVLCHQFLCANGFPNVCGGFWGPKVVQKWRIVKNTIFKPKSLHKTLGFGRCNQAPLSGNFFGIFLQILY